MSVICLNAFGAVATTPVESAQRANDGQDTRAVQHYFGLKNIQHMVCYTEPSPERLKVYRRSSSAGRFKWG